MSEKQKNKQGSQQENVLMQDYVPETNVSSRLRQRFKSSKSLAVPQAPPIQPVQSASKVESIQKPHVHEILRKMRLILDVSPYSIIV